MTTFEGVVVHVEDSFDKLVDGKTLSKVKAIAQVVWIVDSPEVYDAVVDDLRWTREVREQVEERRKAITSNLDKSKKLIMDLFRPQTDRIDARIEYLRGLISDWQERVALEKEASRKEAERLAEEERQKMSVLANRLQAEGKAEDAERVLANSALIIPAEPVAEPEVKGVYSREVYVVEVTDIVLLCAHIAANPNLAYLVEPATSKLAKLASAHKGDINIPGVRVTITHTPVVRKA